MKAIAQRTKRVGKWPSWSYKRPFNRDRYESRSGSKSMHRFAKEIQSIQNQPYIYYFHYDITIYELYYQSVLSPLFLKRSSLSSSSKGKILVTSNCGSRLPNICEYSKFQSLDLLTVSNGHIMQCSCVSSRGTLGTLNKKSTE